MQLPIDTFTPEGASEERDLEAQWEVDPEHLWIYGGQTSPEQKHTLQAVLVKHKGAFAYSLDELPGYTGDLGEVKIVMKDDRSIWTPPRRYSPLELQVGREKVKEMLDAGIVTEIDTLNARHSSAVTMPAKKAPDGTWSDKRFCVDLRAHNANAVLDKFQMPLPEDLFRRTQGKRWLSKLDCRSGFFNLVLSEESRKLLVFSFDGKLYQFNRLPFGHVNSTAYFQKVMQYEIDAAGLNEHCLVYVDDVLVVSETFEEHAQHLERLLERFAAVGMRCHPSKTILAGSSMPYLGHVVSADGMRPDEAKVAAINALPEPTTCDQVRSALGVVGFYRCYVPGFSAIAKPLNALLKKNCRFDWGEEQRVAYTALKAALTTPGLVLRHPVPDRPFHLYTDWSTNGIAAVLNQREEDGSEYMVACVSRSLNEHERRYEAWKGEALAAVWGVKTFRPYLHGVSDPFHLHTDHRPLLWLLTAKEPTGQQARWILSLQDYSFVIVHRPGKENIADLPSRYPCATMLDTTGARLNASTDPLHHPLPQVFRADGTVDYTDYTHDLLCRQHDACLHAEHHPVTAALLLNASAGVFQPTQLQHQAMEFLTASHADDFLDSFAPLPAALLAGHNGSFADTADNSPDYNQPLACWQQERLEAAADYWVRKAQEQGVPAALSPLGQHAGALDEWGVRPTAALNTASVSAEFFQGDRSIVLVEPFGGLCSGLEMALRNNKRLHRYLYLDTNPTARKIALERIKQLMALYPTLLTPDAVQGAFDLPQDIRQLTTQHLVAAGAREQQHPWLVVAGWPCQDLSMAGKAAGLQGERSSLLHELARVIGALQQLQPDLPPAYLIENVAFQCHPQPHIAEQDFATTCNMIGQPVMLDAAQFGSLAHRVRNWWTNLCSPAELACAAAQAKRPSGRTVSLALAAGRTAQEVHAADRWPRYCCNVPGEPMQAWPTFVAHPHSYAFKPGQPGCVRNQDGTLDQPTANEREYAMGFPQDSTAAPGVTEQQRRHALGEAMDANCTQCIMAIAAAWARAQHPDPPATAKGCPTFETACMLSIAAAAQELWSAPDAASTDIWCDAAALHKLQHGTMPQGTSAADKSRVSKRLAYYQWHSDKLLRRMPDGSLKQVPPPQERPAVIKELHNKCGHFGVRRTAALVLNSFWWHGLQADVAHLVSGCKECSRIRATFGSAEPGRLQPLPIKGLGYRWGVDLAGPLPETPRGHKYVMICIEHFSKHLEAIPIVDKTPECTTYAFMHNVLARFGACAELVHDNGSEWEGAFRRMMQEALIDSRPTSANHPQANGMSEKCVQTVKRALKKMCLERQNTTDWDLQVPWLLMGYRCSPQKSTGFSPYQLLYAQLPVLPPAVVSRLDKEIDFDSPALAAADLARRRELVQQQCPMALQNLQIAQHRDEMRYKHIRSGAYLPKRHRFEVGDFVYTNQPNTANALQPQAKPVIYRITEVRPSGRLILQGKCGATTDRHMSQCAPCHLPGIDPAVDTTLSSNQPDVACEVCSSPTSLTQNPILLCDFCDTGWHIKCLHTPLDAVPAGNWMCPTCTQSGVSQQQLDSKVTERQLRQRLDSRVPQLYPDKAMRGRDAAAQQLHGRLILQTFVDPNTQQPRPYWGRLHFMGPQRRPAYFDVHFDDGDVYQYTVAEVKPLLQPVGTVLPAGITVPGDNQLEPQPP